MGRVASSGVVRGVVVVVLFAVGRVVVVRGEFESELV